MNVLHIHNMCTPGATEARRGWAVGSLEHGLHMKGKPQMWILGTNPGFLTTAISPGPLFNFNNVGLIQVSYSGCYHNSSSRGQSQVNCAILGSQ